METTRIDIYNFPEQLTVKKYAAGWHLKSRPAQISTPDNFTYDEIIKWLENSGKWEIITWAACPVMGIPQGARAFKIGTKKAVRSRWELKRMRKHYSEIADQWFNSKESFTAEPTLINQLHVLDLAYYT